MSVNWFFLSIMAKFASSRRLLQAIFYDKTWSLTEFSLSSWRNSPLQGNFFTKSSRISICDLPSFWMFWWNLVLDGTFYRIYKTNMWLSAKFFQYFVLLKIFFHQIFEQMNEFWSSVSKCWKKLLFQGNFFTKSLEKIFALLFLFWRNYFLKDTSSPNSLK